MFKKYIFLLMTVGLLFACDNSNRHSINNIKEDVDTTNKLSSVINNNDSLSFFSSNDITNDSFVNRVLNADLSYGAINQLHWLINNFKLLQKPIDTEKFFSNDRNFFIFYKSPDNSFLESAEIKDATISIDTNITIGIKKDFLLKKFGVLYLPDSFVVTSLEGYCEFHFYIKNDTLNRIKYITTYID